MKELLLTYTAGKNRYTHAGFAVYKIIGKVDRVMESIGRIRETAEEAIEAAEKLEAAENGLQRYAAFRIVQSKSGTSINGRIRREDLPIVIR